MEYVGIVKLKSHSKNGKVKNDSNQCSDRKKGPGGAGVLRECRFF